MKYVSTNTLDYKWKGIDIEGLQLNKSIDSEEVIEISLHMHLKVFEFELSTLQGH